MKKTLLLALALALPASALAQGNSTVNSLYQLFVQEAKGAWTDTRVAQTFRLKDGESRLITLAAPAAGNHLVVAVCDNDCDDIDLQAFDAQGKFLGEDFEDDDAPIVELGRNQRSSVVVTMASCENEKGCEVKVGLLKVR